MVLFYHIMPLRVSVFSHSHCIFPLSKARQEMKCFVKLKKAKAINYIFLL